MFPAGLGLGQGHVQTHIHTHTHTHTRGGTVHLSQGRLLPCDLVPTGHLCRLLPTWEQRQMARVQGAWGGLGLGWVQSVLPSGALTRACFRPWGNGHASSPCPACSSAVGAERRLGA